MPHIRLSSQSDKGAGELAGLDSEDRFLLAIAASRPDLLPEELPDIDRVTDRIREHRLEGRCCRQRHELVARAYGESLFAAVDVLSEVTQKACLRNKEATEALSSQMYPSVGVVIKGFSAYLLTGDPTTLRSGDIDLIVADGVRVIWHLLRCGFRQTRAQFLHEIGEFSRDGIEFDLQWGFPVNRYPDGLNDGEWRICGSDLMLAEYITAEFVREWSSEASGQIRVPTPELAVLIAASHAFMNFSNIWSISHRGKAWLCLAEFADILDLQSSSSFSTARFHELVLRFRAQDVVSWAESIWTQLSGNTLFPALKIPLSHSAVLPLSLWWNLWIRVKPPLGLLLRQRWFPISDVVKVLKERVPVITATVSGVTGAEAEVLPLLWEAVDCRGRYRFLGSFASGSLRLILKSAGELGTPRVRVRIDFGTWAEEITSDLSGSEVSISDSSIPVQAWINPSTITLVFQFTRAQLEAPSCGYVGAAAEESGRIVACTAFHFE